MFEDYNSVAFNIHTGILFVLIFFTLYVAGPLWLLCLAVPPLRPIWPRPVVAQLITCAGGWLLIFTVLTLDPTTFTDWFLD
jgi:hypothetical protein